MSLLDEDDRLPAQLDADTIQKRFLLSREDLSEVRRCRGAILRVCYAIQLCVLTKGHGEAPYCRVTAGKTVLLRQDAVDCSNFDAVFQPGFDQAGVGCTLDLGHGGGTGSPSAARSAD